MDDIKKSVRVAATKTAQTHASYFKEMVNYSDYTDIIHPDPKLYEIKASIKNIRILCLCFCQQIT